MATETTMAGTHSIINDTQKNSELLESLNQLTGENQLETVSQRCDELEEEYNCKQIELPWASPTVEEQKQALKKEYSIKIWNYLQETLGVMFDMKDNDMRNEQLADFLFSYLMKDKQPDETMQNILRRIRLPLDVVPEYSWYEFCSVAMNEGCFARIQYHMSNDAAALEHLIRKHPQLLLNWESSEVVRRLTNHLSFDVLHNILLQVKDDTGRTHIFLTSSSQPLTQFYDNHVRELYELLSIQDVNGQTALHSNARNITQTLIDTYLPKYRKEIKELLGIRDKNDKLALEKEPNYDKLPWLSDQLNKNRYVLYNKPAVLIIYATHRRRNAKEEAESIFEAFQSTNLYKTTLAADRAKEKIFELIKQSANEVDETGRPVSALIVVIMSHGNIGIVDDGFGEPMLLKEIETAMCKEAALRDRPKILITQCCQSQQQNIDDKNAYTPTSPHFCAIMSSVSGQFSKRGLFISTLAEGIKRQKENEDIFKIINNVCSEMESGGHRQTPIIMGTLKAQFCLAKEWWSHYMQHTRETFLELTGQQLILDSDLEKIKAEEATNAEAT